MQKITYFLLVLILSSSMFSCRKKGCTDENASNYSAEASIDDGSCFYLDGFYRESSRGFFINETINGDYLISGTGDIFERDLGVSNYAGLGTFLLKVNSEGVLEQEDVFFPFELGSINYTNVSCNDGGVLMLSESYSNNELVDITKLDINGNKLWSKKLNYSVRNMVQGSDDCFYLTGMHSSKMCVAKIDSEGNELWVKTYDFLIGQDIISLSNGDCLVVGSKSASSSNGGVVLSKINASGNVEYTKTIGNEMNISQPKINYTSDGNFMINYIEYNTSENKVYSHFCKIDTNGDSIMSKKIEGHNAIYTTDNGFIVCKDNNLMKYDLNENLIWSISYQNEIISIKEGVQGNILITGGQTSSSNMNKVWFLKLSSNGNPLIDKTF